jgi:hypothetical protein
MAKAKAKAKAKGKDGKTVQSKLSETEYNMFKDRLKKLSAIQNMAIKESPYIRKLILDDMKKGDDP